MTQNYYEILGITMTASGPAITDAFAARRERLQLDGRNGDRAALETLQEVMAAYRTLINAESRALYDEQVCVQRGGQRTEEPEVSVPPVTHPVEENTFLGIKGDPVEANVALPIPWEIGGAIHNSAVHELIANSIDQGEEPIATLMGIGEKTNIAVLFGEKSGAALGGSYLLVTDRRVVVMKSGVGAWVTGSFGLKAKSLLYDHIASVDVSKGLMFGEIEIVAGGMNEKGSGGFLKAAGKDSVVQFEKKYFDEVQRLAGRIRDLATSARRPTSASQRHEDIPDKIRKLAELRDAGILSETEFQEKKRELLCRL